MNITDIYEAAKALGLARSLRQFSTDYLRMAPNYAAARSELAKNMGLGQQRRKQDSGPAADSEAKAPAPRGRRPKVAAQA